MLMLCTGVTLKSMFWSTCFFFCQTRTLLQQSRRQQEHSDSGHQALCGSLLSGQRAPLQLSFVAAGDLLIQGPKSALPTQHCSPLQWAGVSSEG